MPCACQQSPVSAGHGLQWLWPFLLGFDHHRTAVLDSVCIVHPKDELQNSLQTALRKPGPLKPHQPSWPWFPRWQWHRAPDAQQDFQGQDWDTLHFQPLRAPGGQLVEDETEAQLSKFGYKPELYGVKRKTAEMLEYVFQPWYQELLDMGNLQVSAVFASHPCLKVNARHADGSWPVCGLKTSAFGTLLHQSCMDHDAPIGNANLGTGCILIL